MKSAVVVIYVNHFLLYEDSTLTFLEVNREIQANQLFLSKVVVSTCIFSGGV